jgi:hypothetical protein
MEGEGVNGKMVLALSAGLAAAWATSSAAMAAAAPSASDQNLRYARAYVERANDMLSHDQEDYGGHRVTAMNDISQARADLTAALRYDRNPDDAVIPKSARPEDADLANFERGQAASNENLEFTRKYLERAIDMLSHDAHDYGGYRVKAIADLRAAREQLRDAMQYRDAHHESPGTASDENLRYSRLYLDRAVDMLQHDMHDYSGHRAAALTDITKAQADLTAALRYDTNHEDSNVPTHVRAGDEGLESFFMRGQFASNENIEYVRRYVERAIDMLQHDKHDYHGYRVKAIADLQAARQQLALAIKSR